MQAQERTEQTHFLAVWIGFDTEKLQLHDGNATPSTRVAATMERIQARDLLQYAKVQYG